MESSYGIGVTNRYALFFDNEDDPLDVLKIHEQEKEAKKKSKVSEKENKGKQETKGKPAQADRKGIKETQNVKTQPQPKAKEGMSSQHVPCGRGCLQGPRVTSLCRCFNTFITCFS